MVRFIAPPSVLYHKEDIIKNFKEDFIESLYYEQISELKYSQTEVLRDETALTYL